MKKFMVQLHFRGGKTRCREAVEAACEKHARRVAVAMRIATTVPKTKPRQWVVDSVAAL